MTADLDPIRGRLAAQRAPNDHDCEQASADIATLLARIDELEAVLRGLVQVADRDPTRVVGSEVRDVIDAARAVLGEGK